MKKKLLALLFVGILALGGCQSKEAADKEKIMKAFENIGMEYSTVIANVLSKEWNVVDGEELYEFTKEGTGTISGEGFSYSCGFDEDNQIALKIVMDDSQEERYYYVTTDDTGYGLHLNAAGNEEDVYLFQNNVELIPTEDERAKDLVGEWADKSDNRYILREDSTMTIQGSSKVTEGTYSVVEQKADGTLLVTLVFGNDTMEFTYSFLDQGDTVQLCRPGTDTVHTWIRK